MFCAFSGPPRILRLYGQGRVVVAGDDRWEELAAGARPRPPPHPDPIPRSAFAGFRFPSDVIGLAVRWYLRFGPSYRDVEKLLAERGVEVDHVTI